MQQLIKHTTLWATIALLAFNSCIAEDVISREPNPTPEETVETKTVIFRFSSGVGTRHAEGSQTAVPDGTLAYFDTGRLFFTDDTGIVLHIVEIVPGGVSPQLDAELFRRTGGTGVLNVPQQTVTDVPGHARWAYVVANNAQAHSINRYDNIANLRTLRLSLTGAGSVNQNLAFENNAPVVNLYGRAPLNATGTTTTDGRSIYLCRLDLMPTTARIEMAAIQGHGRIASFNIRGIFFDNLFTQANTDSRTGAAIGTNTSFQQPGIDPAHFQENTGGARVHWFAGTGLNVPTARVEAGTDRVWAMQLFAEQKDHPEATSTPAPYLVLHLDNVYLFPNENGTGTPVLYAAGAAQFVTLNSFLFGEAGGSFAPLTHITPGSVYHIENVRFGHGDLSGNPNLRQLTQPTLATSTTPICNETRTLTLGAATGGSGSYTYEWQRSLDNGATIEATHGGTASADGLTFITPTLNATAYFRRIVTDGVGNTHFGNWVQVASDCPPTIQIGTIRWATANLESDGVFADIGANGSFFQWGRNAAWHPTTPEIGVAIGGWDINTGFSSWTQDPCPAGFRLPTRTEFMESLVPDSPSGDWVTALEARDRGFTAATHPGRIFPAGANSTNGIFLPAVGFRRDDNGALNNPGTSGYYWSSTTTNGWSLYFTSSISSTSTYSRAYGFSVRCVVE